MEALPSASFTVSDISGAMLLGCEKKTKGIKNGKSIRAEYIVSDMADGIEDGGFDMAVSALALQWSGDFRSTLEKMREKLAGGGTFFFSTLTEGTFAGVIELFRSAGVDYPGPEMLSFECVREACLSAFSEVRARNGVYMEEYASVREFLRYIKAIGAGNGTGESLSAPVLRRVMKSAGAGALSTEYHLAFFECVK